MTTKFLARVIVSSMLLATMQLSSVCQAQSLPRRMDGIASGEVRDHRRGTGDGQLAPRIRDHRLIDGNSLPPVTPPGSGPNNGYSGVFHGASRIEVAQAGISVINQNYKNVGDLNLPATMETAWLVIRGMIKNELTFFFEKGPRDHRNRETLESLAGRNLYDLSITMADSSRATTFLVVPADGQSVTLKYRVPGNKMRFKAEVNNFFDPTISVETTITVSITLRPSGDVQNPLRVADASIQFSDTKASVDGNIVFDAVKKLVEFIQGSDYERKISSLVNGRRQDITAEAAKGIGPINNKLRPHAATGATAIKFLYDRPRSELVLRMSFPEMVLTHGR